MADVEREQTQASSRATASPRVRRVFDCCIFNGEMDVLAIRLHELNAVVDYFVITESTITFSGKPRVLSFDPCDPRVSQFVGKVRHVIVTDVPETNDTWTREKWQRNAVLRGAPDADATDLLVFSDVDEIPRASVVAEMAKDHEYETFGVRLAFSYFYVNYRNVAGPECALTWTVAAVRRKLDGVLPDELRYSVRDQRIPARIFDNGGWHFSYLMDEAGIRRKVAAFSHQELNNAKFLDDLDIRKLVREERDLFDRPGFEWKLLPAADLPHWLLRNRWLLSPLFCPTGVIDRFKSACFRTLSPQRPKRVQRRRTPVIICPYLYEHEANEVRCKFGIDDGGTPEVELYLWQDKERIGPERAFEHCWNQFPGRDIVIIHTDMAPMPGEPKMRWFDELLRYRAELAGAGMIACNLYYPRHAPDCSVNVQCAGGTFRNGEINHLHGPMDEQGGVSSEVLSKIRSVEWVTFGGVLIRREVLDACGSFDRRYEWAYVMDVDYSFEARLRGFRLFQVPVSLQHEESRTTRRVCEEAPELLDYPQRNRVRFYSKWKDFYRAMPADVTTVHNQTG